MNIKLAKELVKTRRAVQQKYRALKSELAETESPWQKQMQPISEPLQKLLGKVEPIKTEKPLKVETVKSDSASSTPKRGLYRSPSEILDTHTCRLTNLGNITAIQRGGLANNRC